MSRFGGRGGRITGPVGANAIDFLLLDSVNASLGPDTPTAFDPGRYRQRDLNVNLDLSRRLTRRLQAAAGLEWRNEGFRIGLGDEASWRIGPYAALRLEDYEDFGSVLNGLFGYARLEYRWGAGS